MKSPSSPDNNAHELIANITQLMAEAEEMLSESTSHHAEEKVELLRSAYGDPENGLVARYAAVKATMATLAKRADAAVQTFPYESLAIALGVGVLLGATLRGRGSRRG